MASNIAVLLAKGFFYKNEGFYTFLASGIHFHCVLGSRFYGVMGFFHHPIYIAPFQVISNKNKDTAIRSLFQGALPTQASLLSFLRMSSVTQMCDVEPSYWVLEAQQNDVILHSEMGHYKKAMWSRCLIKSHLVLRNLGKQGGGMFCLHKV